MVDLRVDRGFNLGGSARVRGFVDLFNITNSNAAETRTITTGTAFLRPDGGARAAHRARRRQRVSFLAGVE